MRIKLEDLNKVLYKVQKMAQDVKLVTGLMMEIYSDTVAIAYFDNKKAVYESIDAEVSPEEQAIGKVILPYSSFIDVVNRAQPSSALKVDNLDLTFDLSTTICTIRVEKYTTTQVSEEEFTNEKASVNESDIKFFLVNDQLDKKYTIVSRFDYKGMIFKADSCDTWDKAELVSLLSRLSKGDENKTCYILSNLKAGFIVNQTSIYFIQSDGVGDHGFTVNCKVARYLTDVIGKMESGLVNLTTIDSRYCAVYSDDMKCGVWFEMTPARPSDMNMLAQYQKDTSNAENPNQDRAYEDIKLMLKKDVYADIIKNLKSVDKNDSSSIKLLDINGGTCTLEMGDKKKGNVFTGFANCKIAEPRDNMEVVMIYSTWESILNICTGDFVEVDAHRYSKNNEENNYFLRFMDIKNIGDDGNKEIGGYFYCSAAKK